MRFFQRATGGVIAVVAVSTVAILLVGAPAHDVPEKWKYPHNIRGGLMSPTNFEQSWRCARCHLTLFHQWEKNHGLSWKRETFQYFYNRILQTTGKQYETNCVSCHAPISLVENTYTVSTDTEKEGVSCDFCHTIVLRETGIYESRPGKAKRGPRYPGYEASHGILYDNNYARSEFCTTCHIWKSQGGIDILDDYLMWGSTREAAEGKQCQHCHMPRVEGYTADSGGFQRPDVASHTFLGTDDLDFVKSAFGLKVSFERDPSNRNIGTIRVEVTNKGAAHMLPGGLSWRRYDLVLRIRNAEGDKVFWAQRETFKRDLADSKGRPTIEDWKAYSVISDTRLKPGETRVFTYTVDLTNLPTDEPYYVSAQIFQIRQPSEIYDFLGQARRLPLSVMSTFSPIR